MTQQIIEDAYRRHYRMFRKADKEGRGYDQARHIGAMRIHGERLIKQYGYKEEDLRRIEQEEGKS